MQLHYKGFMREKIQRDPITISPHATFFAARNLIQEKGIRHLPVVDRDGSVVGIVTDSDIRKASPSNATSLGIKELNYLLTKLKVASFMTPKDKLLTITTDTLLEEAIGLLHDHKIGCLPVMEGNRLYGIFTETDALEFLVDIFGLKQEGTRLTVAVEDKPGSLLGVLEVFYRRNINIISLVCASFVVDGKRLSTFKIQTKDYRLVVEDLEKAGYEVPSVGTWKREE